MRREGEGSVEGVEKERRKKRREIKEKERVVGGNKTERREKGER